MVKIDGPVLFLSKGLTNQIQEQNLISANYGVRLDLLLI